MIARYLRLVFWPSDLVINYGPPVAYSLGDVLPYVALVVALAAGHDRCAPLDASGRISRRLVLHHARAVFQLRPDFDRGRCRAQDVPPADGGARDPRDVSLSAGAKNSSGCRGPSPLRSSIVAAVALGALTISRNREHQSWLTLAQTTLERWPTDVAHGGVGSELARLRRDTEALPHLQIAARTDARARYNLGITLYNLKRYDEAIRELDVLVGRYPNREEVPWSRRMMGYAHAQMSHWPEAIAQLRLALSMAPQDVEARRILVDAYNSYGIEFAEAQKYEEAIEQFRRRVWRSTRTTPASVTIWRPRCSTRGTSRNRSPRHSALCRWIRQTLTVTTCSASCSPCRDSSRKR